MKNQTLKHSQSSFTLIELLVVIVIIGILAGVLIVSFGRTTD
ncbi:MAG TPA: type II secretion system protein, partial [Candidatus Pacearchaeota archaeon]|nr:type II secretion system protein [Candidatus Pacearchaeota archaeon]